MINNNARSRLLCKIAKTTSTRLFFKTHLFIHMQKICVHTRNDVEYLRPHKIVVIREFHHSMMTFNIRNSIKESRQTKCPHVVPTDTRACFESWYIDAVTSAFSKSFVVTHPHDNRKTAFPKIFSLKSVLKKVRFWWPKCHLCVDENPNGLKRCLFQKYSDTCELDLRGL